LSRPKTVDLFKKTENIPAAETGIVLRENAAQTADVEEKIGLGTDIKDAGGEEYFPDLSGSSSNSEPIAFKVVEGNGPMQQSLDTQPSIVLDVHRDL